MTRKIIFTFRKGEEELVLDDSSFSVVAYEGLESTDYDMLTEENVGYAGERKRRMKILKRPIAIEFDYLGYEDIPEVRQKLIGFFSPYSSGNLTVDFMGTERAIEYEVQKLKFSSQNVFEPISCLLELVCVDPDFQTPYHLMEAISTWVDGWKWKFKLPFHMKRRGDPRVNIVNDGHVETPIEVEFHGPAENPRVTNLTRGEYVQVNRTLTSDDTLFINTAFRNKTVEIERNGVREDAFDYIDLGSTFFSLRLGDNLLEYSTQNDLNPQSVIIRYKKRYLGV